MEHRVQSLLDVRESEGLSELPLIAWEPAPLFCKPDNLVSCLKAACVVDVISPNYLELLAFFGRPRDARFDKHEIESLVMQFLEKGIGSTGKGVMIVRAGEHGCMVASRDIRPTWLPPFYEMGSEPNTKVADPTGAGNAFLGAYTVGFLRTGDAVKAACYGVVGASFALEQMGIPKISAVGEHEFWNGAKVSSRLSEYVSRLNITPFRVQKDESDSFASKAVPAGLRRIWGNYVP